MVNYILANGHSAAQGFTLGGSSIGDMRVDASPLNEPTQLKTPRPCLGPTLIPLVDFNFPIHLQTFCC